MAYFTAVVARVGRGWRARDVGVDDADSLDSLAEALRMVAVDDQPVLAVVEHEDEWFAVVRVDGDEEPRLFVSDLAAASRSVYAQVLAAAADVDIEDDDLDDEDSGDAENGGDGEDGIEGGLDGEDGLDGVDDFDAEDAEPDVDEPPPRAAWAGEPDLLQDLGVSGRAMRRLVEDNGDDPGAVLAEVGDQVGFGGLLEALR